MKKRVFDLGQCPDPTLCPLAQVAAGVAVKVKQLSTSPDTADRLRELGVFEDQNVKLIMKGNNLICQVCNARIGISGKLAECILVEPIKSKAGS